MADAPTLISPPENDLITTAYALVATYPSLGVAKLLIQLKAHHPHWAVSEKRLRKAIQSLKPKPPDPIPDQEPEATSSSNPPEVSLAVHSGLIPDLDKTIPPKVKVKMFGGGKGKGLVAREKMLSGEVVLQEEPLIIAADM